MSALLFAPALTPRAHAQSAPRTFAGTVTLNGWLGTYSGATVGNLTFVLADRDSPRYITKTIPFASDGSFSFTVPQGNYDVAVKAGRFLQSAGTANLTSGDVANFALQLEPGDIDGNNMDNVDDLFTLLLAFNTARGDESGLYETYPTADLNGDGQIGVDDLFALLLNFNVAGAPTPVPTAQWHIANVSLSKTGVVGSATLTGVVTLASPAPAGGTTVTLRSSADYFVTFSSTTLMNANSQVITIPAGATQSAPFMVYAVNTYNDGEVDHTLTDPLDVTISASAYGWTQSAQLTVAAQGTNLTVQNLTAIPANGAVVLDWLELPEGTVTGYNVYRLSGTTATKLNASPLPVTTYVDNGRTDGASYSYQVTVVNLDGTETPKSTAVSTIAGATQSLTWSGTPVITNNQMKTFSTYSGVGVPGGMKLLVDGLPVTDAGLEAEKPGKIVSTLDLSALSTGNHNLQLLGWIDENTLCVSPVMAISVTNSDGQTANPLVFDPTLREVASYSIPAGAGADRWVVQLTDAGTNTVVRSWSGTGSQIKVAWDGSLSDGTLANEGDYQLQAVSYQQNTTSAKPPVPIKVFNGYPNALFLLTSPSFFPDGKPFRWDKSNQGGIENAMVDVKKNNPGFRYFLMNTNGSVDAPTRKKLKMWMSNSATDFYFFGHGGGSILSPQTGRPIQRIISWGGILFYSSIYSLGARSDAAIRNHPDKNFVVPQILQGSSGYNFAFIDGCNTSGGIGVQIGQVDDLWARAFKIGDNPNYSSAFIGWNGAMGLNAVDNGNFSPWLLWRIRFWQRIGRGYLVTQSINYANSQITDRTPSGMPDDVSGGTPRLYLENDTQLP